MIWVIDIIVVAALLFSGFGGFRRGLVGMAGGALVFLLRIVFALAVGFAILLAFQKFGAVNALTITFDKAFGEMPVDEIGGVELGSIGNIIATAIFGLIAFAIAYIIVMIVFHFVGKLVEKIKIGGTLGLVDKILGAVLGVAVYVLLLAMILAFIYAFAEVGLIVYFDELLRACPITGLLYANNGFSKIAIDTGIAQFVQRTLTGGN